MRETDLQVRGQKFATPKLYPQMRQRGDDGEATRESHRGAKRTGPENITHPARGSLMDSASMGLVESTIRWWRARLKTMRLFVERKYGKRLGVKSPLWPFLVMFVSWLTDSFRVRADGTTAYMGCFGHAYNGEICCFSETVLAKLPMSKTRRRGKRIIPKVDTS